MCLLWFEHATGNFISVHLNITASQLLLLQLLQLPVTAVLVPGWLRPRHPPTVLPLPPQRLPLLRGHVPVAEVAHPAQVRTRGYQEVHARTGQLVAAAHNQELLSISNTEWHRWTLICTGTVTSRSFRGLSALLPMISSSAWSVIPSHDSRWRVLSDAASRGTVRQSWGPA